MSKVILVTGGNRGIGRAIVQRLLEKDSALKVIIGSRSIKDGEEAVAALKQKGLQGASSVALDVTSDESIASAVKYVEDKHGKLDVLVNNAGIADAPGALRDTYAAIYSVNVISVAATMNAFLPLLQKSSDPRIVNVSSNLASITDHVADVFPADLAVPYTITKTALNMLSVQFQKSHPEVEVYSACPGHCATALNNYIGPRDPLEGANVVVILSIEERGKYEGKGFWHTEGDSLVPTRVPW